MFYECMVIFIKYVLIIILDYSASRRYIWGNDIYKNLRIPPSVWKLGVLFIGGTDSWKYMK